MNPHAVPSHVAVLLAGDAQGVQDVPQLASWLLSSQVTAAPVPHAWKPLTQAKPHADPEQVAMALSTAVMQVLLDAT